MRKRRKNKEKSKEEGGNKNEEEKRRKGGKRMQGGFYFLHLFNSNYPKYSHFPLDSSYYSTTALIFFTWFNINYYSRLHSSYFPHFVEQLLYISGQLLFSLSCFAVTI